MQRNYSREEEGRVVLYTTSMGVIRKTWEQCRRVKNTLQTLLIRFEERDVFMNRTHQKEVMDRMGLAHVVVPQLFVEGQHLGVRMPSSSFGAAVLAAHMHVVQKTRLQTR